MGVTVVVSRWAVPEGVVSDKCWDGDGGGGVLVVVGVEFVNE